jgi:hypothetical protein
LRSDGQSQTLKSTLVGNNPVEAYGPTAGASFMRVLR